MTHVTRNSLTNYLMTNIRMTHLSIRSLSFINVVLVNNLRKGGSKSFIEKNQRNNNDSETWIVQYESYSMSHPIPAQCNDE